MGLPFAGYWFKPSLQEVLAARLKMQKISMLMLSNTNQVTMTINPTNVVVFLIWPVQSLEKREKCIDGVTEPNLIR